MDEEQVFRPGTSQKQKLINPVSTIDVNEGRDKDNLNRTVSPRDRETSII